MANRKRPLVVVTRKVVGREEASALAARLAERTHGGKSAVAALEPVALRAAHDAATRPLESLRARDVVVVAGVGEPELVAAQVGRAGAAVRLVAPGDHFVYSAGDAASIAASVPPGGVAVTTAKDAVKLASLWPAGGAELLVLELGVRIESGAPALDEQLTRLVSARQHTRTPGAATLSPARDS